MRNLYSAELPRAQFIPVPRSMSWMKYHADQIVKVISEHTGMELAAEEKLMHRDLVRNSAARADQIHSIVP